MKHRHLLLVAFVYLLAAAVAFGVYVRFESLGPILAIAAADLAATLTVFIFSMLSDNSSIYDPYWSVAPIPIALAYAGLEFSRFGPAEIVLLALMLVWSIRLTRNWATRWEGFGHEDWRYRGFRNRFGGLYWLVSLGGIHLVPTIFVYGATLPLRYAFVESSTAGLMTWAALLVVAGAIVLEAAADVQMNRFLESRRDDTEILSDGLWGACRHPNYLGEVSFWWGLWLFALSLNGSSWWTMIGPVAMTVLFLTVSIPMLERRMERRKEGLEEYRASVPALIPVPDFVRRAVGRS